MKTISLNPFQTDIQAQIGDTITYSYNEHISVGYTADFEIEDESVLKHLGTSSVYENPERMKEPGISGADAALTTFSFEVKSAGTTLLIIRNYFRSNLESEYTYRITIQ